MPTPDFVLALRERLGHDLLWMTGRHCRGAQRRAARCCSPAAPTTASGPWSAASSSRASSRPTGCCARSRRRPASSPSIEALTRRLDPAASQPTPTATAPSTSTSASPRRHVSGEARVNDDESTRGRLVRARRPARDLMERSRVRLRARARLTTAATWFEGAGAHAGGYAAVPDDRGRSPPLGSADRGDRQVVLRRATRADVAADRRPDRRRPARGDPRGPR